VSGALLGDKGEYGDDVVAVKARDDLLSEGMEHIPAEIEVVIFLSIKGAVEDAARQ
jgi:hypothetical protein